jgi:hypothetical protein
MPKFVIERTIPNAGKWSARELHDVAGRSCRVLRDLGPHIQWLHSYVTDDKVYCLYIAPDPQPIRDHAVRAGFPADSIREVRTIMDPTTAD